MKDKANVDSNKKNLSKDSDTANENVPAQEIIYSESDLEKRVAEEKEKTKDEMMILVANTVNHMKEKATKTVQDERKKTKALILSFTKVHDECTRALKQDSIKNDDVSGPVFESIKSFSQKELERVGATIIHPNLGDDLDTTKHCVIKTIDACDKDTQNTISRTLKCGVMYNGTVLLAAEVISYSNNK